MSARRLMLIGLLFATPAFGAVNDGVRIKDLGRIEAIRDNALVGYGIVSGLAGTGDSPRSRATVQSIANVLSQFGVAISAEQVNSRNVAAVLVTANLPAFARSGDRLDVNVSSMGDARSLVGGNLLLVPLYGPDRKVYALAQGAVSVGGFKYDLNGNVVQKNHPTAGSIPGGAIAESGVPTRIIDDNNSVKFVLFDPDFTTANRIANTLNATLGSTVARAIDPGRIELRVPETERHNIVDFVTRVENTSVVPDQRARIVVNERTGTIVSGGDVKISMVTVSHGDLRVAIKTDYLVSQPSLVADVGGGVRTEVVPNTRIEAKESNPESVSLPAGTTVADLVGALSLIKASTRDIIGILQSIKSAGALHAELVIQ